MGRHSAPEDTDEDVEYDGAAPGGGATTAVATEPPDAVQPAGRHADRVGGRPRPTPGVEPESGEPDHDAGPPAEGLSLLDDAFGPDAHFAPEADVAPEVVDAAPGTVDAADAPTTRIPMTELARDDRALPEETTATIPPVADLPPVADVPPVGDPAATAPEPGGHATAADLALIRTHGDVRARVIAAVLAPFVVFVAVFAVRGDLDVHSLVWIWIPAIVAGVLVGALLDAGHKRYAGEHHR